MKSIGDQYEIISKIGEGGMGAVYKAKDIMLHREVAIKQLHKAHGEDEQIETRFQQEALALAKLNHPNITHLYSFIPKEDTFWMVMEYVEGKTLEDWLRIHKKITSNLVVSIAVQMLEGLEHAHRKGIIHRDMKPANVMIHDDGEVKIMDFGIARMKSVQRVTQHGKSVGTLEYMAPEQIQGKEGDERTDIYAVAVIMYELLCGIPPFQNETDYQLMKDKLEKDPAPMTGFNNTVSPTLQKCILKAMDRNPAKRYSSSIEFKTALKNLTGSDLLSHSSLHEVLKASQVFSKPRNSGEILSVNTLLSRARQISSQIQIPSTKKINKPVILLAASVLICVVLLLWNAQGEEGDVADMNNQKENLIPEPTMTPAENTPVEANAISFNETPNEMYNRINQQKHTEVYVNKTHQPRVRQEQQKQPAVPHTAEKKNNNKTEKKKRTERNVNHTPVDVPAGKHIRVSLTQTITSADKSKDGNKISLVCNENVTAEGRIIIKKGARVIGKIVDVIPSDNGRKNALIGFVIQKVEAVDGSLIRLHSERFRLFANAPGQAVSYKSGQVFTAELGRGRVK